MTMEEKMAQVEAQAAAKAAGAAKADTDLITGHLDVDQLNGMKMSELKALANDMGLKYAFGIKKDDLIDMIAAVPVQVEKEAIVETTDTAVAEETAPGLGLETTEKDDNAVDQTPAAEEEGTDEELEGRVLVTYTGMVNLRDENLAVVDQAMQGQAFTTTGKCEKNGAAWYRVVDRFGRKLLISAAVVRYMA